ncbi:MAG: hypothetical protein JO036_14395 [Candidatus Eremiobacteraeota bacterium]|nr:hypothetical protein [Candidatus Eremiobacteraeota bacterium]
MSTVDYARLFETTATVSGGFFVACLVIAQLTVDRERQRDRARLFVEASPSPPQVDTPSFSAELFVAALVVAALNFNALLGSILGFLPYHPEHFDGPLINLLQSLGFIAYVAPLAVLFESSSRFAAREHFLTFLRGRNPAGGWYAAGLIGVIVMLSFGIIATWNFYWDKTAPSDRTEALAWKAVYLIVLGGCGAVAAMVAYFVTRPSLSEPTSLNVARAAISQASRWLIRVIAIWLVALAGITFASAIRTVPYDDFVYYVLLRWMWFSTSLATMAATATTKRLRESAGSGLVVAALLVVAIIKNPIWVIHLREYRAYLVPDSITALSFVATAGFLLYNVNARSTVSPP